MLIGEVAERSGISTRMLRHYDRTGVVSPSERTAGDYRQYTEDDLRRLFHVEGLRSLGLSLKAVAEALDSPDFTPAPLLADLIEQCQDRIAREHELLATLERVRASDPEDWTDVLHTVSLLRGLDHPSPSARQRLVLSLEGDVAREAGLLVEAALREPDPTVAGTLYWALARAGDAPVPLLAQALRSTDADRRHRAVEALEKINTPPALSAIASAGGHLDPYVARRATIAAGRGGDASAAADLVALVTKDDDAVDAIDALRRLATDHAAVDEVDRALAAATAESPPVHLIRLIDAISEVGSPGSRQTLRRLMAHGDRQVALAAQYSLDVRSGHGR
ncbi:MerR family transcriptional regulator [Phycicoccus sp. KQZ13P-1]|uniref:MerR family transcriptional regulator n=1 Tax=Phycicoccus mangrovi TaxID=2840470 RepID=UPI001C005E4A|nr:MerR family transcriptional regulator [Phycicoccus mangrovi]MBT9255304.1 MerR family transcriptional regulator [Phycicoccus mangrovi]